MRRRFEYKFVRLDGKDNSDYQQTVREESERGWRLVQVFAPGAGGRWARPNFVELIFEQELVGQSS